MTRASARQLRERVAAADGLRLRLPRAEVLAVAGPRDPSIEEDPVAYASGMLVHQGLRCEPPLGDEDAGEVELSLHRGYSVAGLLWTVLPVAAIGFAAFWGYGVILAAGAAAVAYGLRRWYPEVVRRTPRIVPPGRVLGVVVGLVALALLAVAGVLPVRAARTPGAAAPVTMIGGR